jgi:predicted RND superfamily exporter protein
MKWIENNFGERVIARRWWIIIATLLVVAAAGYGARFLTFDNDVRMYFSSDNPQLQALEALENTYSKDENILFVLAPEDQNVFSRETLTALTELTEAAWQIPYSTRVDSIANFQHSWAQEDELIVEDLVSEPDSLTVQELDRLRKIALAEPVLVNRVISSDGRVTAINVLVTRPGASQLETDEVAAFARRMTADFADKYPAIPVHLTGGIMIDAAFGEAARDDMTTLVPAMYGVLFIIMGFALRSLAGTFATFCVVAFSMITALGLAGWFGIALSPSSVNAPTIILTLAVADSIHILVTVLQQMHREKAKNHALVESLRINLQPVFVTSITTVIGFLSMNFSDAPPFHDLGNIVAMGVGAAWVYSVLFLPALLAVLPLKIRKKSAAGCDSCLWLADFVIKGRRPLFWMLAIVIALLASGTFRIELNDDFVKYFDDRYAFRRATDFAEKNLTGFNVIEYTLEAGEPGGINEPDFLAIVDRFTSWYRQQPKIAHVFTLTDTMKRLNRNMHGDDPAFYRLPEQRDLAAQYLLLYEMSLPFGLDLNKEINVDKSAIRIVVRMKEASTRELRDMDKRAQSWLRQNAPPAMFSNGTGLSIVFAHISERNIKSMLGASFGALVLISGILIVSLRSVKFGLLSLIPNLTPAFMAFGIWGLTVGQVGLVISILAALTLGIVVDDTVHFMSKYLRARREYGMAAPDAVRYSYNTVGTAMWITSVVLVAGFLVLALSGFEINSDMGLMTALTIVLALLLDFLFLPILLMKMDGLEKSPKQ